MANELKPWKYDIQYGPEGEASYAWVYDDHGVMVATMRTHKAKEIVDRMNTRPAVPVEGLETVADQHRRIDKFGIIEGWQPFKRPLFPSDKHETRELVTRSKAEAIIAAKDADIKRMEGVIDWENIRRRRAEADNAALTARVKEVETQLAAAQKALQEIAGDTYDDSAEKIARNALEAKL